MILSALAANSKKVRCRLAVSFGVAVSLEHSPIRQKRFVRPREAWTRLGISRATFYQHFVTPGRIRLFPIGERATACWEHDLEQVMDEIAAEGDGTSRRALPLNDWREQRSAQRSAPTSSTSPLTPSTSPPARSGRPGRPSRVEKSG
jgi:hypothetical protein